VSVSQQILAIAVKSRLVTSPWLHTTGCLRRALGVVDVIGIIGHAGMRCGDANPALETPTRSDLQLSADRNSLLLLP
jgi:hypothetical protein